jgi:hypothetical protein
MVYDRLTFADCAEKILSGVVDAAFLFPPVPSGIKTYELVTMPRVACIAETDALAHQGPLTLAQFSNRPLHPRGDQANV